MDTLAAQVSAFADWLANLHPLIGQFMSYAGAVRLPIRIIGGLLCALAVIFVVLFVVRGIVLRFKLLRAYGALRKRDDRASDFSKIFAHDKTLAHLWREYEHTLHRSTAVISQPSAARAASLTIDEKGIAAVRANWV